MKKEKNPVEYEQLEHLKEMKALSGKKKFQYFWMYYKWYVVGAIALTIFLVSMIKTIFFTKPYAIYGEFINAPYTMEEDDASFIGRFAADKEIDTEKNQLYFDSMCTYSMYDYASGSKMLAAIAAGEIDFLVAPLSDTITLADNEFLDNPYGHMNDAQLSKYEASKYLYDYTLNENTEDDGNGVSIVGIKVSDSPVLIESGCFSDTEPIIFCIPYNAPHPENAILFLEWLYTE